VLFKRLLDGFFKVDAKFAEIDHATERPQYRVVAKAMMVAEKLQIVESLVTAPAHVLAHLCLFPSLRALAPARAGLIKRFPFFYNAENAQKVSLCEAALRDVIMGTLIERLLD